MTSPAPPNPGVAVETSVVVRTFNEARNLSILFECLASQSYQDFETIVVDSGSVDGTRDVATAAGVRLECIDREQFTFGYSLNVGIRAGVGRLVAIVSAHAFPADRDWLATLVAPLRDGRVAMVYGRQLGTSESKFAEAQDFRRSFGTRPFDLTPPAIFPNNANSAIRRDLWALRPFDAGLTGLEDAEWARHWLQNDYRIVYEPRAAVYHVHRETWAQIRHRYYREAVAARQIGARKRIHAFGEVCRESLRLIGDTGRALVEESGRGTGTPGSRFGGLLKEIVKFRIHKTAGIVQGLLDGVAMQDKAHRARLFFESSYDAVVVEGPGRVALRRVDMPEIRPDDVLIKVAYVGVCGTDLEIVDGTLGYFKSGLGQYPIVPGHEMSGEVAAFGPKVTGLAVGDRVVVECIQSCGHCASCRRDNPIGCSARKELGVLRLNGAYAGYVRVPRRFVHVIPNDLSLDRAALCEPTAVVMKGIERLSRSHKSANESWRCAVVGAGPLGGLCGLALRQLGHRVTTIDRDPKRTEGFARVGLEARNSLDGLDEFDVLVEATGNPEALETLLEKSPAGSTMLLLGLPYASRQFNFETVVAYDKAVVGSVGSGARHFEKAIAMLPKLPLDAYLEDVMPLESYAEAWKRFRSHDSLKVLLRVG